jgi:hypothetical protein
VTRWPGRDFVVCIQRIVAFLLLYNFVTSSLLSFVRLLRSITDCNILLTVHHCGRFVIITILPISLIITILLLNVVNQWHVLSKVA